VQQWPGVAVGRLETFWRGSTVQDSVCLWHVCLEVQSYICNHSECCACLQRANCCNFRKPSLQFAYFPTSLVALHPARCDSCVLGGWQLRCGSHRAHMSRVSALARMLSTGVVSSSRLAITPRTAVHARSCVAMAVPASKVRSYDCMQHA
jgi:hypothetical protein